MTHPPAPAPASARRLSAADAVARRATHKLIGRARHGELVITEPDGRKVRLGHPDPTRPLRAEMRLHDWSVYRQLFTRGSRGGAEAYFDRQWDSPDLVALVALGARNMKYLDRWRDRTLPFMRPIRSITSEAANSIGRSKEQISAHYDLSNDLFALFLDPTLSYSCAVYDTPGATLEEAQEAKLERICRKLQLRPGLRLLEIGTGWGGLAIHAAKHHGVHVTTTTISGEQHDLAAERIAAAGLSDRIDLLERDYRDLDGTYDRLVSIEMIEAVGWRDVPTFFQTLGARLADDGLALLQAITIDDRAYEAEKRAKSFINQYIFPGGCLPSLAEMARAVNERTELRMVGFEDITAHYVETLREWRSRFHARTDEVLALGYDDRFLRLWDLYLAYCEAGFAERRIGDVQVLYAGPRFRTEQPLVGDAPAVHPVPVRGRGELSAA